MRAVEAGEINCVIFKDLSRLGRNYPELGKLMEDYFPQKGVRVISVLNNLDSLKSPETYCSAIVSFSNIVNDDYIRLDAVTFRLIPVFFAETDVLSNVPYVRLPILFICPSVLQERHFILLSAARLDLGSSDFCS